ncbi:MAG TPA: M48 family metallopeptidase [Thermoanaerobaculia bacterium]|nr:M48 family metallopeptidase [Thermoanaerobaculia bacterium]
MTGELGAIGLFVLAALLVSFALDVVARWLNLRAARRRPPEVVADLYQPDEYARSQRYLQARSRFGLVVEIVGLAALLGFWFAGGFGLVDRTARALELGAIPTGLVFVGILGLLSALLSLPFDLWSTFVLEERFGFNRTTLRTFVLDRVKGALLALALGVPLLAAVFWLFERAGGWAWLWCWALMAAVSVVAQIVVPAWILPLFHRFERLEEGELRAAIEAYAERVGFPLEGVFVIDGSRRSSKANAFFTGLGRRKRIALFDTLVERHPVSELVAVLAHEVGHFRLLHVPLGTLAGIAHTGLMLGLLQAVLWRDDLYRAFFVERPSVAVGLVLFGLLAAPLDRLLGIALHALSRRHEHQADRFAVETTGDPTAMTAALRRLSRDQLTNLTPHPLMVWLAYSHPPLARRLEAIAAAGPGRGHPI